MKVLKFFIAGFIYDKRYEIKNGGIMKVLKFFIAGFIAVSFSAANLFAVGGSFESIKKNEIDALKLIFNKKNINEKNDSGDTPLIYAVQNTDKPEVIEFLVKIGAKIEEKDKKGYTPLMIAVKNRESYPQIAMALIKNGAKVNAYFDDPYSSENKNTPLMYACAKSATKPKVIQALIDNKADIHAVNTEGNSVLIIATKHNAQAEIIDILLKAGAKIEEKDKKGYTPLMIAVKNRESYPQIAMALIKNGANVNAYFDDPYSSENKNTPLMYACAKSATKPKVIQALIDNKADIHAVNTEGNSVLIIATKHNAQAEIIDILLKAGAKIEEKDKKGYTPLMIAVKNRESYPQIAMALIKNGANVNAYFDDPYSSENKNTPLMYACAKSATKPKVIQSLIDNKADIHAVNTEGNSVLIIATKHNAQAEIIDILLKAGTKIEEKDKKGYTPLMIAVKNRENYPQIAMALIKNGANVNTVYANDMMTPLLFALSATSTNSKVIQALVDYGADINAVNVKGQTPIMLAAKYGNEEKIKILLNKKASLSVKDKSGKTVNDYINENSSLKEKDLNKFK